MSSSFVKPGPAIAGLVFWLAAAAAAGREQVADFATPTDHGAQVMRAVVALPDGDVLATRAAFDNLTAAHGSELVRLRPDGSRRWARQFDAPVQRAALAAQAPDGTLIAALTLASGAQVHAFDAGGRRLALHELPGVSLVRLARAGGRLFAVGTRVVDIAPDVPVAIEIGAQGALLGQHEMPALAAHTVRTENAFEGAGGDVLLLVVETYSEQGVDRGRHRLVPLAPDGTLRTALSPPALPPPFYDAYVTDVGHDGQRYYLAGYYTAALFGDQRPYAAAITHAGTPVWTSAARPAQTAPYTRWNRGRRVDGAWVALGGVGGSPACVAIARFALADGAVEQPECVPLAAGDAPSFFDIAADGALRAVGVRYPQGGPDLAFDWRRAPDGAISRRDAPLGTRAFQLFYTVREDDFTFIALHAGASSMVNAGRTHFGGALAFDRPLGPFHRSMALPRRIAGGDGHPVLLRDDGGGTDIAAVTRALGVVSRTAFGPSGVAAWTPRDAVIDGQGTTIAYGEGHAGGLRVVAHRVDGQHWQATLAERYTDTSSATPTPLILARTAGAFVLAAKSGDVDCLLATLGPQGVQRDIALGDRLQPLALLRDAGGRALALCSSSDTVHLFDAETGAPFAQLPCIAANEGIAQRDAAGGIVVAGRTRTGSFHDLCRRSAAGAVSQASVPVVAGGAATLAGLAAGPDAVHAVWKSDVGDLRIGRFATGSLSGEFTTLSRFDAATPLDLLAVGPRGEVLYRETSPGGRARIALHRPGRAPWVRWIDEWQPGWTAFGHASIDADGSVIVAGTARLQFGGPGAALVKLDPDAVFYGGFED